MSDMPGMSDGLTIGSSARVSYGGTGRGRWKMKMPVDGANLGSHFRVMRVSMVPGLELPTHPILYKTHVVGNEALGIVGKKPFNHNIMCLGSPKEPKDNTWGHFDEAGLAECNGMILPAGISLHSLDTVQRFLFVVFLYNHGLDDVRELAFWDWKVGRKGKGVFDELSVAFEKAVRGGATLENTVWEFLTIPEDSGYKAFEINVHRADPGTEYAEKYPFGDAEQAIVKDQAPKFIKEFLPWTDVAAIRRRLSLDGDDEGGPPVIQNNMAGPSDAPTSFA